ncbi:MAG: SAM-dependent methyltransferase [Streptosporangiaceae bacterium]
MTLRGKTQIAAFFDGWDQVEPGLVQVPLWRPEGRPPVRREKRGLTARSTAINGHWPWPRPASFLIF